MIHFRPAHYGSLVALFWQGHGASAACPPCWAPAAQARTLEALTCRMARWALSRARKKRWCSSVSPRLAATLRCHAISSPTEAGCGPSC